MIVRRIWLSIVLAGFMSVSEAQVISSQKSYLNLDNTDTQETELKNDNSPPDITLLSHQLDRNRSIETGESEIVLIGKVIDQSKINSLLVNSIVTEFTDAGVFTSRISLTPGENEIVIVAVDQHDNLNDFRFAIHYQITTQPLAEIIKNESVYYALLIAIDSYSDPAIRSLDNPVSDAQKVYDVLVDHYTFDKDNIHFLKDARRDQIIYTLDHLSRIITPYDNLLIFYAGHGWFDEKANIGYWLPSDAMKISKAHWFRNSTLVDYLKEIDSKHTLLITDACFGGSIFKTRSAFSDADPNIEALYELPSRKAMTSGSLSEVSDNSAFARFLIDRLKSNRLDYMTSEQLFNRLRIAVMNNSDTEPQYGEIKNVGDQGGDFIFIRK